MPNHCQNNLVIEGPGAEEFIEKATTYSKTGEAVISILATYYPCPKRLIDTVSGYPPESDIVTGLNKWLYGHADWYSWCNANWGTKWGDYSGFLTGDDSVSFESAWGPPIEGFEKVSKMFPELQFRLEYFEPGMSFIGRAVYRDGLIFEYSADIDHPKNCPRCNSEDFYSVGFYDNVVEFYCESCEDEFEVIQEGLDA